LSRHSPPKKKKAKTIGGVDGVQGADDSGGPLRGGETQKKFWTKEDSHIWGGVGGTAPDPRGVITKEKKLPLVRTIKNWLIRGEKAQKWGINQSQKKMGYKGGTRKSANCSVSRVGKTKGETEKKNCGTQKNAN